MIRPTVLLIFIATLGSTAFGQETKDATDLLFQEILSETIPKSDSAIQAIPGRQFVAPPAQQVRPIVPKAHKTPVVSPQNWSNRQPQAASRSNVPAIQTSSASRATQPPSQPNQNVLSSTDSVSIDLIAPADINLNQKALIRVQLKNVGQQRVNNVKFVATLPKHVRFEAARPQPTKVTEGRLEFDAIQLAARSQSFIEIDVVPTAKTPINIGTQLQYANENQIAIAVREPALDIQIEGPQEMILGESRDYLITVVNRGDGIANNLRFSAEFPEGLQKLRADNTVIPQLAPGKTAQIKVTAQSIGSGEKNIKFLLASTELEPISRQAAVVVLQPELDVTATGPSVNFLNRDGIYRIEIANPGKVNCSDVEIDLVIPAEMNVSTISREAKYDEATRQLSWTFPEITAGKTEVIQLKAQCVAEGQHSCGIVVRSNQTIAKEFRLNTMVATRADVSIAISNDSGPVQVGASAAFAIVIENKGSRSAEDVRIDITLPAALAPEISKAYEIDQYDNSIKFQVGEIRSGEKKVFNFSAVGSTQGEHVVRSELSLSGSARKIIAEDSVYVFEADQSKVGQRLEPQIRR